ncbi:MAG TPA: hypothetical protein VKA63_08105 [Candidatus Krumholzibacteria bacterium]|nr:hypothetical protein [Candidatus Krumholzibacteria bacterium]
MKKIFICMVLIAVLIPVSTAASEHRSSFGAGIILGEPTGVSMKLWTGGSTAVQGAVAWSFTEHTNLHLHADYIWHRWNLIQVEKGSLPLYFGVGGRLRLRDEVDDTLGVRFPVGLAYEFADAPFDLFLELVPVLDLTPSSEFDLNAALGGRYYF